tara:strand:+ start:687 stop:977 length:291 start_codon:yes stop_codon:yes gene_type:complete
MVELEDNMRLGLLVGAAALLVFELLNMPGMLGGGEKLFLIDLVGLGSDSAFRADTGFSTQDIVGFLSIVVMAVLYFVSKEDDLDWEALLGDDDEEE